MRTLFIISILITTVFSALPPQVIQELKDNAEEYLKVTIISTELDSTEINSNHLIYVRATAVIDSVERSNSNLFALDTISLNYIHRIQSYTDTVNGEVVDIVIIGQGPPKIVETGNIYYCYLNEDTIGTYTPAVYSCSFTEGFETVGISMTDKYQIKNKNIPKELFFNLKGQKINREETSTQFKHKANGFYLSPGAKKLLLGD